MQTLRNKIWSSKEESDFAKRLRAIGTNIQKKLQRIFDGSVQSALDLSDELDLYAIALRPWAEKTAWGVVYRANNYNLRLFKIRSAHIHNLLKREIMSAPTGQVVQTALSRQVGLITSLPVEAAQRVSNLALTGYVAGRRVGEIRRLPASAYGPLDKIPEGLAKEIMKTGHVTASRANLIARTETTRVSTELTKARAEFVGSETYKWQTAMDEDVRMDHRRLQGTIQRWDSPPIADSRSGTRAHPGCIWNCRCYAIPIIPDIIR